ncbi:hypothetical protein LXL04_025783 [Taraxacum kok-saghyz]
MILEDESKVVCTYVPHENAVSNPPPIQPGSPESLTIRRALRNRLAHYLIRESLGFVKKLKVAFGSSFSYLATGVVAMANPKTLSFKNHTKNEVPSVVKSNHEQGLTYKEAGVDIDAGSELVRRIAKMAPGIGGFGGLFPLGDSYLVAGTDGVGTKLKLAFETGIHDSIGIDLVAMSVNDIITSGAKPLFFLDYYATSRLDVDLAEKVIKGIVDGCQQSDCALLGGETAEMPDFYAEGEYDLSGFAVGIVKKDKEITFLAFENRVLARSGLSLKDKLPGESVTLAEALMAPTVIYVKQVLDIINKGEGIKGIAHITGGGFTDNIPRVFPKGLGALVYNNSWPVPPVFNWIQKAGGIEESEMKRTFNMGIGMVLVVSKEAAERIINEGEMVYRIGEVISGDGVSYQ